MQKHTLAEDLRIARSFVRPDLGLPPLVEHLERNGCSAVRYDIVAVPASDE
jgi:hypothetical protein